MKYIKKNTKILTNKIFLNIENILLCLFVVLSNLNQELKIRSTQLSEESFYSHRQSLDG